jgi:enoyl-CoA hydratase
VLADGGRRGRSDCDGGSKPVPLFVGLADVDTQMINRDDAGEVAVIRLAYGKVSALDTVFCASLADELTQVASGPWRALVLTGTGSSFSAGVDLFQVLDGGADYLSGFLPAMERLFRALLTFPKPAVAAINGHAIAGGCILAAACDYRVMADGSGRIGVPELAVGVPFPTLPFEIVGARVPRTAFRDLVYSGRTVTAVEALPLGLVDEVASPGELMPRAQHEAARLAQIPAITFALTKRTFTEPILARVDAASSLNDDALAAWRSAEVQARMRAYLEKTVGRK